MIVSMMTESYADWGFHFLTGVLCNNFNSDEKILINLINFSEEKIKILKEYFPSVIFENHKIETELKDKNNFGKKVFKVTYLKGEFVYKAFKKYQEPVLWIDITALVRSNLTELTSQLGQMKNSCLLMRRDFDKDSGKTVYAAEIFGMNDLSTIEKYRDDCNKRKEEWFADQLALCEIETPREYIHFGSWSNFNYREDAKSWSDRGKSGGGKSSVSDCTWTQNKFIEDLEHRIPDYRDRFYEYRNKIMKYKILIFTDDKDWCYHNTINEIAKNPNFEFTILHDLSEREKLMSWEGDLVWARCGSYRHKKLLDIRPDLRSISFSTITTGGEVLLDRFKKQIDSNSGEAGVIVQNQSAKLLIDDWIKKEENSMECFILPNGVDVDQFTTTGNDKEFTIGFSGRTLHKEERMMKGFEFVKVASEIIGAKLKIASNTPETQIEFKDMPEFYRSIDVLVLPSHSEGCSNTINEALASGVPVITTKIGFHGDISAEGIIFVEREIKSIVDTLNRLRGIKFRESMSKKARKWAEDHSWEKLQPLYTNTFFKMIKLADENRIKTVEIKPVKKVTPYTGPYIELVADKDFSLGKIEKNGAQIWFEKGVKKKVKYDDLHKPIIDRAIKHRFLKAV